MHAPIFRPFVPVCAPVQIHVARGIMSPVLECDMDFAHLEPGMVAAGEDVANDSFPRFCAVVSCVW
jgi:hypothetical protein